MCDESLSPRTSIVSNWRGISLLFVPCLLDSLFLRAKFRSVLFLSTPAPSGDAGRLKETSIGHASLMLPLLAPGR